jgi:hypothetical protein
MLDPGFLREFAARVGPPVLAGTIVAALLRHEFGVPHGLLIGAGLGLMLYAHWGEHHRR